VTSGGKDQLTGAAGSTMEAVAFRRSAQVGPGSSRWRCKHQGLLRRCGLPDEVLRSDRALLYVLLHGDDELGTGWTPAWIEQGQAEELLAFLRREIVNPVGYDLIRALERRLAAPDRPAG
jgi:hypothetical protein